MQIPTINHLRNEQTTAWIGVWVRVSVRASVSCGCFSASGSVSSCQPVVMATLRSRLRVSSLLLLPGSTDLFSSAPFCCAQPLQLSGNGGCRHSSAVQLSWRAAALQLFAVAAAALLLSPQLLSSAGPLSAHLLPLHWAPGSPASLSLTFSADLPPNLVATSGSCYRQGS